jgi:hypothetical protein
MRYIIHAIRETYKYHIRTHKDFAKLVDDLEKEDNEFESQLLVKDINDYLLNRDTQTTKQKR